MPEEISQQWYIFDVYGKGGGKITCKVSNPLVFPEDFANLMEGVKEITEKYGVSLTPPDLPKPPSNQIPLKDELGTPVVNQDGQPVMTELPPDVKLYTVKALWHGQLKDGKSILKVQTVEQPYDGKFGVNVFGDGPQGWETWALDAHFAPPATHARVLIRDPKEGSKYPRVEGFRPA